MLPIGNLTVFLSVPPSYQYLHSPFTTHISPIHHSPIHSFTHSHFTTHHSPFTIHSFIIHHSPIHHSPFAHPPTFLLVFFGKAPFYPKSTRRIIEQHPKDSRNEVVKRGQVWTNLDKSGQWWSYMDKHGQRWSELVKCGQRWTNMDKHGQIRTKVVRTGQITQGKCLVFSCVISLGNHSKKNIVWQKLKKESLVDFREK